MGLCNAEAPGEIGEVEMEDFGDLEEIGLESRRGKFREVLGFELFDDAGGDARLEGDLCARDAGFFSDIGEPLPGVILAVLGGIGSADGGKGGGKDRVTAFISADLSGASMAVFAGEGSAHL